MGVMEGRRRGEGGDPGADRMSNDEFRFGSGLMIYAKTLLGNGEEANIGTGGSAWAVAAAAGGGGGGGGGDGNGHGGGRSGVGDG